MNRQILYWVWLSQCFPYGSSKIEALLDAGADPKQLYEQGEEYWRTLECLNQTDRNRMKHVSMERAELILDECEKKKIQAVCQEDGDFPPSLRHVYGPPAVLYYQGNLRGIADTLRITVVGTRNSTDYAKKVAGNISYLLAKAGVTVISGCAVGIDEYAHRGAIKAGGRSVGVLACGADVNYPKDTKQVREHILYLDGALVTELPPGVTVSRHYFPTRNRLMAGLAEGVFVVQAPERSGALITADLAVDQGKELFCLPPGNLFAPEYQGVVPYLRDGATPVYGVEDILGEYESKWADRLHMEALQKPFKPRAEVSEQPEHPAPVLRVAEEADYHPAPKKPAPPAAPAAAKPVPETEAVHLNGFQKELYLLLEDTPRPLDVLTRESGKKPQEVLAALTELEILGVAKAYPGRMYGRAF